MEALFCSVDLHFWETCLRPAGEIKPKLINISDISRHAPPYPQWSPDGEEAGGGGGGVGGGIWCRGEAKKPFLNCHHFAWQPIEQKPSFRLIIHWLEILPPMFFIWKVHNIIFLPKTAQREVCRFADFLLQGNHHVNLAAGPGRATATSYMDPSLFPLDEFLVFQRSAFL